MNLRPTPLDGLYVAQTKPHADSRGAFARLFCERDLLEAVGNRRIVQVNHSRTSAVGALRGMHFQRPPHAEMKCVRCLRGKVWDVALDLRAGSPTFLEWYAHTLTPDGDMMVIPEGFAHGFQVLEPESELLYLHTSFYAPEAEGGVRYDDPRVAITWPLHVSEVSRKDRDYPLLASDFPGLSL